MRNLIVAVVGLLLALSCVWAYSTMDLALAEAPRVLTIGLAGVAGLGFWLASRPKVVRTRHAGFVTAISSLFSASASTATRTL